MNKIALLFVGALVLAFAVVAAGCVTPPTPSGNQTQTPAPADGSPVLTVAVAKDASDVFTGDKIQFVLPSNPTTGYEWNVTASAGLTVVSDFIAPAELMPGAGGQQVYTVSSAKAGTYTFTAVYKRSWETSGSDLTFTQTIVVHDADGHTAAESPVLKLTFDGNMNPKAGEAVRVTVAGNPTTGYEWNTTTQSTVKILSSDYLVDAHEEGMVGVGGTYIWNVTAEKAGTYVFAADYKRPWMTEDAPANAFLFNLTFM